MTKIEAARAEYKEWCQAVGIDTLQKVNETVEAGKAIELINLCEARQERQYAQAADQIFWKRHSCRIVMMSGPPPAARPAPRCASPSRPAYWDSNPRSSNWTTIS